MSSPLSSRIESRIARLFGLASVAFLASTASLDSAVAANDCRPGKMNMKGTCDCPAGYSARGPAGDAKCVREATCGVPGKPACPTFVPGGGDAKIPADAGTLVAIKGGSFVMGDATSVNASPAHSVTVTDFQIDKYEVSVLEYEKCIASGSCSKPGYSSDDRCNFGTGRKGHPMNCLNHSEADTYCRSKGRRLPTEAEWEFAARGPTSRVYPWGSTPGTCAHANFTPSSGAIKGCGDGTSPIGTHALGATREGVHDLAGNVEEWTWDYFANYSGSSGMNPAGPFSGPNRVAKGNSFDFGPEQNVSARRETADPTIRREWLGFRCALGAIPSPTPSMYVAPAAPVVALPPPSDLGTLIKIPGGTFRMGDTASDAGPEHDVTLSPYVIDKYEVTSSQYRACVAAGSCTAPTKAHDSCTYNVPGRENSPIACISWSDARNYCSWNGKRLPTEAEWEFAARGFDGRPYPWGVKAPSCLFESYEVSGKYCSGKGSWTVGTHPANVSYWGLMDMGGNVSEWVFDRYAAYSSSPAINPTGATSGSDYVMRGGNWEIGDYSLKSTFRRNFSDKAYYWVGVRCARSGS